MQFGSESELAVPLADDMGGHLNIDAGRLAVHYLGVQADLQMVSRDSDTNRPLVGGPVSGRRNVYPNEIDRAFIGVCRP